MNLQEKKVFINELKQGQQVQEVFLLTRKTLAETKAGKPYLAIGLMDKTGEMEARLWDDAVYFNAQAEVGDFVLVNGSAKSYRDQTQLGVSSLQRIEKEAVCLEDYMPASRRNLAEMREDLLAVIDELEETMLRPLLQKIFSGETLSLFVHAPAAKKMHHAYIGGLVEHTLSIVGLAQKVAEHYPMLDRDMLIAGVLLHDLAKIEEFDFSSLPFEYTGKGRLVGHLVLGVDMVREAAKELRIEDEERLSQLIHLILSHHGQLQFGSPVVPMTPEAIILHHLDDIDAKMNYIQRLTEELDEPGWQWSEYQRPLERFLYLHKREDNLHAESPGRDDDGTNPPEPARKKPLSNGQARQKQQSLF